MKNLLRFSGLSLLFASTSLFATVPNYKAPEILARANIGAGYNLPEMTFLSNTCPVINNEGDVAFKLMAFGGGNDQGIWLNGKIVYSATDMKFITDPSINDKGFISFHQYDDFSSDGIFSVEAGTDKVNQVLKPENDQIMYYTYPQMLSNGKVYFRATDQETVRSYYQYDGSMKQIISEGVTAYGQKSSYLFRPSINDSGALAFKRRIGEQGQWDESNPDEILLLKPKANGYESVVIAKDRDGDHESKFAGFTNAVSLSANNLVVFVAYTEDNRKAIILSQDGKLKNLAIEKADNISEIELFSPKVNAQGLVVFRAKDMNGKRGIYVTSLEGTKKLVGEGDSIMTDLGEGIILSNPNFPGFGGEVDMNDHGEIVFYCLVMGAKDNQEWGSAVFKISPLK